MSFRLVIIILTTTILLLGLNIFYAVSCETNEELTYIPENILRLHVLGNSNTWQDQINKLYVRDLVLSIVEKLFVEVKDSTEAVEKLKEKKDDLVTLVNRKLHHSGKDIVVSADIGYQDFPKVKYDHCTLPAGNYQALQVKVGKAEGLNWWCVLFPSLCFANYVQLDEQEFEKEYRLLVWDIINKKFNKKILNQEEIERNDLLVKKQ